MKNINKLSVPSNKICGSIKCPSSELQLKKTLLGGQCFRWKQLEESKDESVKWRSVFSGHVWTLSQSSNQLTYEVVSNWVRGDAKPKTKRQQASSESNCVVKDSSYFEDLLRNYFRLNENLGELYSYWASRDPCFEQSAKQFFGIRVLKQDPVENIFSFICSTNNNITRITSMVDKLCLFYGEELGEVDGTTYYDFPQVSALAAKGVEEKLRKEGFGYRAKYLHQSAQRIQEQGGLAWVERLETLPYAEAKRQLMTLPGVGAKVADCICLMSLGHLDAIPVDTHVFQISQRYLPHLKGFKTVTDKVYAEISSYFQQLYGKHAGWAHSVLFCADLRQFQASSEPSPKESGIKKKAKRK